MKTLLVNRRHLPMGLLTILIFLDVAVRLLEKAAVVGSLMDSHAAFALNLMKQPWWWLGLALGPLQLWVWTGILARTELSVAYPLSSIGYPLTMATAWLVFNEQLGWQVWLGAAFMTVGIALVGSTAQSLEHPRESVANASGTSGTSHEAHRPRRQLNDSPVEIGQRERNPCRH